MINKAAQTHALLKARLEGAGAPRAFAAAAGHTATEGPLPPANARPAHLAKPAIQAAVEAAPAALPEAEPEQALPPEPAAPAEAPADTDTRKSKRRTTRIGGYITLNNGQPGVFCSVRDMSATGALISLNTGGRHDFSSRQRDIPQQFWLQIKQERMQVPCQVIRHTGTDEIGVRFLAAPSFF